MSKAKVDKYINQLSITDKDFKDYMYNLVECINTCGNDEVIVWGLSVDGKSEQFEVFIPRNSCDTAIAMEYVLSSNTIDKLNDYILKILLQVMGTTRTKDGLNIDLGCIKSPCYDAFEDIVFISHLQLDTMENLLDNNDYIEYSSDPIKWLNNHLKYFRIHDVKIVLERDGQELYGSWIIMEDENTISSMESQENIDEYNRLIECDNTINMRGYMIFAWDLRL